MLFKVVFPRGAIDFCYLAMTDDKVEKKKHEWTEVVGRKNVRVQLIHKEEKPSCIIIFFFAFLIPRGLIKYILPFRRRNMILKECILYQKAVVYSDNTYM